MKTWHAKGFTLIELLVTMMVAAIILGIGIPNFAEFIANNRMASATNDLVSALHLARNEAITRRRNVSICPSANPQAANPTCDNAGILGDGFIVFVDCSAAGLCGAPNLAVDAFDTVVGAHGPMPDQIRNRITTFPLGGVEYFSFAASGFPRTAVGFNQPKSDIELCDQRGNQDIGGNIAAGRWVQITPTGRPQIYRDLPFVQGAQNPLGGC